MWEINEKELRETDYYRERRAELEGDTCFLSGREDLDALRFAYAMKAGEDPFEREAAMDAAAKRFEAKYEVFF